MKSVPLSNILNNTNRSPSGSEESVVTVRIFGRSIRQLLSISPGLRIKVRDLYFLNSAAFNKTRVLSGATRAAKTDSVFRNDSLSKTSLELVYGGGDASRKRWRVWAMLRLNNCRFCVNNDRATLNMQLSLESKKNYETLHIRTLTQQRFSGISWLCRRSSLSYWTLLNIDQYLPRCCWAIPWYTGPDGIPRFLHMFSYTVIHSWLPVAAASELETWE